MHLRNVFVRLATLSLVQCNSHFLPNSDDFLLRWIPWANRDNPYAQDNFLVNVKINGIERTCPVDTGSTGFLVSAADLDKSENELQKCCEPAFEYLSSSKRYYEGYWLPSNLTFTSLVNNEIESHVSVLAVTEKGTCTSYTNGNCVKAHSSSMPTGVRYMGIGFGRWGPEQPNATAEKNPMLNIDFRGDDTLRSGYLISDQGVIVGVRPEDFDEEWKLVQLDLNPEFYGPSNRPEWKGTPVCLQVAGGECSEGTALFDTGISYSFLGVSPDDTADVKVPGDKPNTYVLKNGTAVNVKIGGSDDPVLDISFKVAEVNKQHSAPQLVKLSRMHGNESFINTGRYFYNGFGLIFDEMSGTVGIKEKTWGDAALKRLEETVEDEESTVLYTEL